MFIINRVILELEAFAVVSGLGMAVHTCLYPQLLGRLRQEDSKSWLN